MAAAATKFIPRLIFPLYESVPRSYFLGHHRSGLAKMKKMLASIDYVIECRDFRAPVTSINFMFEEALGSKRRLLVYTKRDLGGGSDAETRTAKRLIRLLDKKTPTFFATNSNQSTEPILKHLKTDAFGPDKLVACRVMVVGMPNVGKSTLINNLRNEGVKKPKAVRTGDQPGITRKIATPVKIVERKEGSDVYVLDTPGVFVPYMSDAERMLKVALCGCVKDAIIPPITMADYLLYHINLHNPKVYGRWSKPTNDIIPLLESFAHQAGHLAKGGVPNINQAALNLVQKWRAGELGRFLLDDIQTELRRCKEAMSKITSAAKSERKLLRHDQESLKISVKNGKWMKTRRRS